jgi:hypothetical protein
MKPTQLINEVRALKQPLQWLMAFAQKHVLIVVFSSICAGGGLAMYGVIKTMGIRPIIEGLQKGRTANDSLLIIEVRGIKDKLALMPTSKDFQRLRVELINNQIEGKKEMIYAAKHNDKAAVIDLINMNLDRLMQSMKPIAQLKDTGSRSLKNDSDFFLCQKLK